MVRIMSKSIAPSPNMKRTDRDVTAFGELSARDDYPYVDGGRLSVARWDDMCIEIDGLRAEVKRTDRDITAFSEPIEVAIKPVTGPDGVPLRLFGNAIVRDVDLEGHFGIVDKYGEIHWIEINFG